ncbi:uncharacterized protein LOC123512192 [Portunus trituberculatus]|uniref:uncharacterized protein LOC123512192 n=1 Tax=Portunus trituberculatus TaxID=210409 RepID=UPI001E1CE29E|nr:uncharacterized protein LOC123512192 [Portunus trituberculatus]
MRDQVWMKLQCFPGVLFGFCYAPPPDSPYFDFATLSYIQERVKSREDGTNCIIVGDLNARFGETVSEIPEALGLEQLSYPSIPNQIRTPNDNVRVLLGICLEGNLLVMNNLQTRDKYFPSKLTYRQGMQFVSELDLCLVSPNVIDCIHSFDVNQDVSLPSDHAPISVSLKPPSFNMNSLYDRACELGAHAALISPSHSRLVEKPIKFDSIDPEMFSAVLSLHDPPSSDDSVEAMTRNIRDTLYKCAGESRVGNQTPQYDERLGRWDRLLKCGDEARIWSSINWRGEVHCNDANITTPTDTEFKDYLEQTLNPPYVEEHDVDVHTNTYIPILDDPITQQEVYRQIGKLKSNKACGPDGLTPGIFKLLPRSWILCIVTLFNSIFISGMYPQSWMSAKMSMVFKRGSRAMVSNYRGISVINSLSKIYDMILCDRLSKWFIPCREQAGGQAGRGCTEHIVPLRLLTDLAKRKKFKLFIVFVDFSQAYDRVRRNILLTSLMRLGCGMTMLCAIVTMYRETNCIVGTTALITASIGVRQGSPTSCLLFILYVNDLIRMLIQNCGWDGFLGWLHVLALMDDTILLSTSRHSMIEKLKILNRFCNTHEMKINVRKTKFFVVNGDDEDKQPIRIDDVVVEACDRYVYLGSPFTADGIRVSGHSLAVEEGGGIGVGGAVCLWKSACVSVVKSSPKGTYSNSVLNQLG